jgi:hypothetical protein
VGEQPSRRRGRGVEADGSSEKNGEVGEDNMVEKYDEWVLGVIIGGVARHTSSINIFVSSGYIQQFTYVLMFHRHNTSTSSSH